MKSAGLRIRKPKERGEWAELRFMAKAAELGFKLTKPWGDSAPYDLAIERGGHFVRVQVKSTMCRARPKKPHHQKGIFVANMRHIRVRRYQQSDFDYLAVYVIPKDVWYIIPSQVATRRIAIRVAPSNPRNQYEPFREAWHLLRDSEPTGPKPARGLTLHAVIEGAGRPRLIAEHPFSPCHPERREKFTQWTFLGVEVEATARRLSRAPKSRAKSREPYRSAQDSYGLARGVLPVNSAAS